MDKREYEVLERAWHSTIDSIHCQESQATLLYHLGMLSGIGRMCVDREVWKLSYELSDLLRLAIGEHT